MKRRLATVMAIMVLLLALAAGVRATTYQYYGSGTIRAYLYENSIGDASDGNDVLAIRAASGASVNIPNLQNVAHTLPGNCNRSSGGPGQEFLFPNGWNDCVSSISISAGWKLCAYRDANYVRFVDYFGAASFSSYRNVPYVGWDVRTGDGDEDYISSVKLKPYATGC